MRWLIAFVLALVVQAQYPPVAQAQSFRISEEDPPHTCSPGNIVSSFGCSGDFCDNISIQCRSADARAGASEWTHWIEADGRAQAWCTDPAYGTTTGDGPIGDWFLSGIACRGGNCDDISLHCTRVARVIERSTCRTTRHSDESRGLGMAPGYAIVGIRCSGRHCDDKDITYCRTRPLP